MILYRARWVLPISATPIRDGLVGVQTDRIVFVGSQQDADPLSGPGPVEVIDLGHAALMPGLVNTHSHLELTVMRGLLEALPFVDWIRTLTRLKYEQLSPEDHLASSQAGAAEAIRAGVTTLADTADSRAPFDAMREAGLRGIVYREVFGPDPGLADRSLHELRLRVEEMLGDRTGLVQVGISPHAPYTVSSKLFRSCAEFAKRDGLDVCMHAAESREEDLLLRDGAGPFSEALRARGIEWDPPGQSTVRYLESTGILDLGPLLVHCVNVDSSDLEVLARRGARVAHCPKSNAKLGHGVAPLGAMLDAGIKVGLGTDSVASNNRLDLIDEARFCCLIHRATNREFAFPDAVSVLRLMTLGAADALGLDNLIGSLEPGKQADMIAIDLAGSHVSPCDEPESAILFSALASDVRLTMVAGRILYSEGELHAFDEEEVVARVSLIGKRLRG